MGGLCTRAARASGLALAWPSQPRYYIELFPDLSWNSLLIFGDGVQSASRPKPRALLQLLGKASLLFS